MPWYTYIAVIVATAICMFAVIDVKTRQGIKKKKEAEKAARKKAKKGKKKK